MSSSILFAIVLLFPASAARGAVRAQEAPAAGFSLTPAEGHAPLRVEFTDESSGEVSAWSWNFGDGRTSAQRNPAHTFQRPGVYSVTLEVSGPGGEDALTRNECVVVGALPAGFVDELVLTSLPQTTGFVVRGEDDVVVWTKHGQVWRWLEGSFLPQPLVDIREEVGNWNAHGLHGFAFDPGYASNGFVYLYYVVDRHHLDHFGTPAYDPQASAPFETTIGRITRFAVHDPADPATTVDPSTRTVLVGENRFKGIPVCAATHGLGQLFFGQDGSLMFTCGDSTGTPLEYECLGDGIFRPKDFVGGMRSQLVDSPNGKIHRIDPATGNGLASNPFFDPAQPRSWTSRVWALGVRQPYRVALRPGHGSTHAPEHEHPGVLYVGDVGTVYWEEISVVTAGGQNLGWPMYEGFEPRPTAPHDNQDARNPLEGIGGCTRRYFRFTDLLVQDSLLSPSWPNPCDPSQQIPASIARFVHRRPALAWQHGDRGPSPATFVKDYDAQGAASVWSIAEPGAPVAGEPFAGNCSIGGAWYSGFTYPEPFRDVYFHADFGEGWIRALEFDEEHELVALHPFASDAQSVTYLATDPAETALYFLEYENHEIHRILYGANAAPTAAASVSPAFGPAPLLVHFSSAASNDPEDAPLQVSWNFGEDEPPTPLHRWPETLHLYPSEDVTAHAAPIRSTGHRLQSGAPRSGLPLPVVHDGVFAQVGSSDESAQALVQGRDPWLGYLAPNEQWIGALIFQEGLDAGAAGGTFIGPSVEAWNSSRQAWTSVTNLRITPPYPGVPGRGFETFHLSFDPVRTTAIRLRDKEPRSEPGRITVGELRLIAVSDLPPAGQRQRVATLTVTDPFGEESTATTLVSPGNTPPSVEILSPLDGATYPLDQASVIPLVAHISDAQHDAARLTCEWRIQLVHDNHVHPEPPDPSCASSATILPHEELQGDVVYWTFELVVTDPDGLSTSVVHTLIPAGDCNLNGIHDAQDILDQTSSDENANGIPDECEGEPRRRPGTPLAPSPQAQAALPSTPR